MSATQTPALILHVMPYRETSAIVRLFTPDLGVVSAIARGARRAKSRTGPRLDLFASGSASLLIKPHRDLHPLIAFELSDARGRLASDVGRFAAASALSELVLRCAGTEPQPAAFDAVTAGLDALASVPAELADTVALVATWGLVVALGFAPAVDRCVTCGDATPGALAFSAEQGGALCGAHARGVRVSRLQEPDAEALRALVSGRVPEGRLGERHLAAHRRLLSAFIRHHLAEHREMPALAFWDAGSWNVT